MTITESLIKALSKFENTNGEKPNVIKLTGLALHKLKADLLARGSLRICASEYRLEFCGIPIEIISNEEAGGTYGRLDTNSQIPLQCGAPYILSAKLEDSVQRETTRRGA